MRDEADIVKELKEEEKLGRLKNKAQCSNTELQTLNEQYEKDPLEKLDGCERHKIEDPEQSDSNCHFRSLFNAMVDPVVIVDSLGKFLEITNKVEEITGYDREELIGKNFLKTKVVSRKSKVTLLKSLIKRMKGDKIKPYEVEVITKNGEKLPYEINAEKIIYNGKTADMVIFRDISQRKKAERELKEAHEKLSKINENLEKIVNERTTEVEDLLRQKEEFIRMLGHDLKNPLVPIKSLMPIIMEKVDDPELNKYLEIVNNNFSFIEDLVINTLKLARLNMPSMNLNKETLNLKKMVDKIITNNQSLFKEKEIKIENKIQENSYVNFDKLKFKELLNNLFFNALKFTPANGNVFINAEKNKEFYKVSIKDTGIGMTKEQIDKIFSEFYKADESRHNLQSSGLGLPICKRIVEKHGGKIWAESPGEGKGSVFYFTIPIDS